MQRTLVVDLLGFTGLRGGTETYARELIPRLPTRLADVRLHALVSAAGADLVQEFFPGSVHVISGPNDSPAAWARSEVFLAERAARAAGADLIWTPANFGPIRRGVRRVVTIHDLIYHQVPGTIRQRPFRRVTAELMSRSARTADAVIAVSQATGHEVHRWLRLPEDRIHVIPNGASSPPPEDESVANDQLVRDRLVLSTGNRMPHKNHVGLLEAIAQMDAPSRPSVVITGGGARDPLLEDVRRLGLESVVSLPGWVSSEELARLYRRASVYVCPSLLEGFGLPVVDALARGCLVVANDIPVLREVGGSTAFYADATDAISLAQAISRSLSLTASEESRRREEGRTWAKRFSWDAAADKTASLLSQAIREHAPRDGEGAQK